MINDKYMNLVKDEHKISYNLYMEGKPLRAFNSHQPLLIHVLNTIKEGNVLEFGMGVNSTPLMHIICTLQGRHLVSIDNNKQWSIQFLKYRTENHPINLFKPKLLLRNRYQFLRRRFSIALIDAAPAEVRQPFIELMKDNVDYMIVHDTECVVQGVTNCYAYNFSMFKHVHHFKSVPPMTSLLSNMDEIDKDVLTVFKGM